MFARLLLLFIIVFHPSLTLAQSEDEIGNLIAEIDGLNGRPLGSPGCDCEAPLQRVSITKAPPAAEYRTAKDPWDHDIRISVLSEEKAKELFDRFKSDNMARWNDRLCQQRAHRMGFLLEQEGIESGKIFVSPKWYSKLNFHGVVPNIPGNENAGLDWKFHVASFVYVKSGNKVEQWVFDPSLFDRPVPRSQWEKVLTSHPSSSSVNFRETNRYVYLNAQTNEVRNGYVSSELYESNSLLSQAGNGRRRAFAP